MSPNTPPAISDVVNANIAVHSAMAATYNEREPHFLPENRASVREVLESVAKESRGGKLLDVGCGTGFVIDLAKDLFEEVHGVDITQAMLDRVDLSSGNITLHNQQCESLPFADNSFDAVTAYSFLDHLEDYSVVLAEAFRVLRPGGVLYADLLPNKRFWDEVNVIGERDGLDIANPIVKREVEMLLSQHEMVEKEYAIDGQTFLDAEPYKTGTRGISAQDFARISGDIGYSHVDIQFQWYLGQGNVIHGAGHEQAQHIDAHLQSILPLSESLYKYLRVILRK